MRLDKIPKEKRKELYEVFKPSLYEGFCNFESYFESARRVTWRNPIYKIRTYRKPDFLNAHRGQGWYSGATEEAIIMEYYRLKDLPAIRKAGWKVSKKLIRLLTYMEIT